MIPGRISSSGWTVEQDLWAILCSIWGSIQVSHLCVVSSLSWLVFIINVEMPILQFISVDLMSGYRQFWTVAEISTRVSRNEMGMTPVSSIREGVLLPSVVNISMSVTGLYSFKHLGFKEKVHIEWPTSLSISHNIVITRDPIGQYIAQEYFLLYSPAT